MKFLFRKHFHQDFADNRWMVSKKLHFFYEIEIEIKTSNKSTFFNSFETLIRAFRSAFKLLRAGDLAQKLCSYLGTGCAEIYEGLSN